LASELALLLICYFYFARQLKKDVCARHPQSIAETTMSFGKKLSGVPV